jgi:hypothetical protein
MTLASRSLALERQRRPGVAVVVSAAGCRAGHVEFDGREEWLTGTAETPLLHRAVPPSSGAAWESWDACSLRIIGW